MVVFRMMVSDLGRLRDLGELWPEPFGVQRGTGVMDEATCLAAVPQQAAWIVSVPALQRQESNLKIGILEPP